jgi:hypothetical protein
MHKSQAASIAFHPGDALDMRATARCVQRWLAPHLDVRLVQRVAAMRDMVDPRVMYILLSASPPGPPVGAIAPFPVECCAHAMLTITRRGAWTDAQVTQNAQAYALCINRIGNHARTACAVYPNTGVAGDPAFDVDGFPPGIPVKIEAFTPVVTRLAVPNALAL